MTEVANNPQQPTQAAKPNLLVRFWKAIDKFVMAICIAAVVGSLLPARGSLVPVVDWGSVILIGILFFLYGVRLEPREALAGLKHWRLHSVILAFTFVVFPIIGLGAKVFSGSIISQSMYLGLLFMCLVPSTVQSSINFTSIARGNIAGAIVSASVSNLIGAVLTPVLVLFTMGITGGLKIDPTAIFDIMLQILFPFILGQLSRPLTAKFVLKHKKSLRYVDQSTILLVVYSAFSSGRRDNIWQLVTGQEIVIITAILLVLLFFMLWLTWQTAAWLKFNRGDQIAIQFCGTKKSLAMGVPMATVLFAGGPIGIIVLPLMIFHMAQLIACGWLAGKYGRKAEQLAGENPSLQDEGF